MPWNQNYMDPVQPVRRNQSSACFTATSRDGWALSHANKTNPPEVGKYKPRYSQIERKGATTKIVSKSKNTGSERILQRELQHSYFCPHALVVLNDREAQPKRNSKLHANGSTDDFADALHTRSIVTNGSTSRDRADGKPSER